MPENPTLAEMHEALNHAVAVATEWDGAGIEHKLALFGLDAASVRELLQERLEQHEGAGHFAPGRPDLAYVQGFIEALITRRQLERAHGL